MLARQIAIGFGVAIIFPLLIYYGVSTFYPPPKYPQSQILAPGTNATPEERRAYADQMQKQRDTFNAAAREFARVLVIVSTPLGIAAILVGAYLTLHAIGTGLIFGGIFTVAWGYWSYWSYLDDWMRFTSLLAGFAFLLFVGIHKLKTPAG